MPFPAETLTAILLIGLFAYLILGISGFGSALVGIPLLVHFLPLPVVVPLVVLTDFCATLSTGVKFKHDVDVGELKRIVPPMVLGILAGVTMLATLPKQATLALLGLFVTGYGLYRLFARTSGGTISRAWAIPTGLAGGVLGGLFGVGGPLYAAYLTARIPDHSRMRATLSAVFSCSTGLRIGVFLLSGLLLNAQVGWAFLLFFPAMLLGLTIGHRLHDQLTGKQVGKFISLLLIASGLSLLFRAF